jgi:hypothetical protein
MKAMRRRPVRSKKRSSSTVEKENVNESPLFFEITYARATSPIRAGSTLLTKRPIMRAANVSRKPTALPIKRDHLKEHKTTAIIIKTRGAGRSHGLAL